MKPFGNFGNLKQLTSSVLLTALVGSLTACSSTPDRSGPGMGSDAEVHQDTAPGVSNGALNNKDSVEVLPANGQDGVNGGNLNGADMDSMQMVDVNTMYEPVIYFGYDQYQLDDAALETVRYHADILLKNIKQKVVLNGHTDERGTPEYNLALGEKRAKAVAQAMMLFGVAEARIDVVSFGEESPQVQQSNEVAWAKNRRVEIAIH